MTATDELRRLLDERGVEHYDGTESTLWGYEDYNEFTGIYRFSADETSDGYMQVRLWHATPEQAIDATLGRGTCEVDVLNTSDCAGYECNEYIMHCNGCGHEFGHVLYNEDGDVWMSQPPNYCPNCGAKVVDA